MSEIEIAAVFAHQVMDRLDEDDSTAILAKQFLLSVGTIERLTGECERLREQVRRDREYCASQTGENVKLANQVIASEARCKDKDAALRKILAANDDFRAQLPADWDGDPLSDACTEARAALAQDRRT